MCQHRKKEIDFWFCWDVVSFRTMKPIANLYRDLLTNEKRHGILSVSHCK